MDWHDQGFILSTRKHGESSAIIDVFTKQHGRHAGLVRGGVSRKMRPILQAGNLLDLEWRARLEGHLGNFYPEAQHCYAAPLMEDRLSLAGLNALCAMSCECLPEREAFPALWDVFAIVVDNLHQAEIWPALYIRWEAGLLSALGYGLDLSSCAATGRNDDLTHVSPRSGRAVCASAAEPYLDKMLRLPGFMRGAGAITAQDIYDGLRLTGYFLETRVQWNINRTLPEARSVMIERLTDAGYAQA